MDSEESRQGQSSRQSEGGEHSGIRRNPRDELGYLPLRARRIVRTLCNPQQLPPVVRRQHRRCPSRQGRRTMSCGHTRLRASGQRSLDLFTSTK